MPPPDDYCGHCGGSLDSGGADHAACAQRLELEPPRYCASCRRRLKVQVMPRGWSATCVEHGALTAGSSVSEGGPGALHPD